MDKRNIIIIILAVILIAFGTVYAYNYIEEKAYQQGFQDAVLSVNTQITNNLVQNGYINFVFELNNETYRTVLFMGNVTRLK